MQKKSSQSESGERGFVLFRRGASLYLDNAMLDGIDHETGGIFAAAFFQDVGAMLIDGAFRDVQCVGNLLSR